MMMRCGEALIKKFEPLMPGGAEAERRPQRRHVDDSIFGVVPLEIARADEGSEVSEGGSVVGGPAVGESAAGWVVGGDAVLDRRYVHADDAAAGGLSGDGGQEVSGPGCEGDGVVSG